MGHVTPPKLTLTREQVAENLLNIQMAFDAAKLKFQIAKAHFRVGYQAEFKDCLNDMDDEINFISGWLYQLTEDPNVTYKIK